MFIKPGTMVDARKRLIIKMNMLAVILEPVVQEEVGWHLSHFTIAFFDNAQCAMKHRSAAATTCEVHLGDEGKIKGKYMCQWDGRKTSFPKEMSTEG